MDAQKLGAKWDAETSVDLKWWQVPKIIRHINKLVCGEPLNGFSEGLNKRAAKIINGPLERGISIGCGNGAKEINLIKHGIVKYFDLFEYSAKRAEAAIDNARRCRMQRCIKVVVGNAFEIAKGDYDIVHWNNALHHMMDAKAAVMWSRKMLVRGGLFYMDDFVGASYFQWPDTQLALANQVRLSFKGTNYLNTLEGKEAGPVRRPDRNKFIAADPSEAADSNRIIQSIKVYFPGAKITNTGGIIYNLALSKVLHNFKDDVLLDMLLIIDGLLAEKGQTHYATALAIKDQV